MRKAFRDTMFARIRWAPEEPEFHLFSLDVPEAGFVRFTSDTMEVLRWRPQTGPVREVKPNA